MLNLLSNEEKNKLKINYYLSLLSLVLIFVAVLFVEASVAILPGYLKERAEIEGRKKGGLGMAEASLSAEDIEKAKQGRQVIDYLKKRVNTLKSSPSFYITVEDLLQKKTDSISINSFSFSKKAVTIHGVAENRNDLIAFEQALNADKSFKGVALPIASLAKSEDNDFTIELTLP